MPGSLARVEESNETIKEACSHDCAKVEISASNTTKVKAVEPLPATSVFRWLGDLDVSAC